MTAWPIAARTLRELRWQIVGYGVGLGLWAFLVLLIYPEVSEEFAGVEFPEFYEAIFGEQIRDITNPATFISLEYLTWVPIVMGVYAVVGSTGLLAGEESRGTADLLFALPVSRRRAYLEKVLGWLIGAVVAMAISVLGLVFGALAIDLQEGPTMLEFAGATLSALPLISFYAGLGLLLAAVAPSRGRAAGVLTVALIVGYVFASFAQLAEATQWLRYLSPFYYAGTTEVLSSGVNWGYQALLTVAAALLAVGGLLRFERREIGVDRWQWPW
jgi:ABC-2 type transport system permease protein